MKLEISAQKCHFFGYNVDILEIGLNGVLRHEEPDYRCKQSDDVLSRVYASIFHKLQICPKRIKTPQNHVLGISPPAEYESGFNKILQRQLEGLQVDFCEIYKFAL